MRTVHMVLLLTAGFLLGVAVLVVCGRAEAKSGDLLLIAHRGVVTDEIIENSTAALEEAVRRAYTHVEVDIRCTRDGTVVCLHDANLKRTAGLDLEIHEVSLAELREKVSSELVPTLDEFCARCEGRIGLMPDLKGTTKPLEQAYLAGIEQALERHDLLKSALFIGPPELLDYFVGKGRVCLRVPAQEALKRVEGVENAAERYFVFNHAADFTREEVDAFHRMGLQVIVSINVLHYPDGDAVAQGKRDVQEMLRLGVDGLQIDAVYDEGLFGADNGKGGSHMHKGGSHVDAGRGN